MAPVAALKGLPFQIIILYEPCIATERTYLTFYTFIFVAPFRPWIEERDPVVPKIDPTVSNILTKASHYFGVRSHDLKSPTQKKTSKYIIENSKWIFIKFKNNNKGKVIDSTITMIKLKVYHNILYNESGRYLE